MASRAPQFALGLGLIVNLAILAATPFGLFQPMDDALRDLRFGVENRAPTGSIAFVDIDSRSLSTVGVWPWPRSTHARLLDALMRDGAEDVVFDVDFSVASSPTEDAEFARALADSGGYAYLAAFRQQRVTESDPGYNVPLPLFAQYAEPVAVNVTLDSGGLVRSYPFAIGMADSLIPSVAAILARAPATQASFGIDFSIDAERIDRISAADLLDGKVDPARIAGHQIVIGASAVELRDYFVVPRFGIIPGALLQILAAETLKQGRGLATLPPVASLALVTLLATLAFALRRRVSLPVALIGGLAVTLAAEGIALLLQLRGALLLDTAALNLALGSYAAVLLCDELIRRGRERARVTRERNAVQRILDQVIADHFDGVVIVDASGCIVAASEFAKTLLGSDLANAPMDAALPPSVAAILGDCLADRTAPDVRDLTLPHPDGDRLLEYVATRSSILLGATPTAVACLTFRDVTERRKAEARLHYLGGHDSLTGALSRDRFVDTLRKAIEIDGSDVAVVVIGLRRFRMINNALGHSQGDLLLKQVVSRLTSMGPDAVARLGGDSFALMVPATADDKLRGFCEAIVQWLAFPYSLANGHQAIIAASAGATTTLLSGTDPDTLLSHADMAHSAARQRAGHGVALFEQEMDHRLRDRRAMDIALRQALLDRQFTLAYQPQIDIATGALVGAEALARWTHPELGQISPLRFIPAAEETGLIVDLGRWALLSACREATHWPAHLTVSVNISPVQFELSDVLDDVMKALDASGLPPSRLEIEITEGVFVKNVDAVTGPLARLREHGVSIALDDFGTGYSSLSYLGRLPIDKIKIDQSFVRRLSRDPASNGIVQAIIDMSHALGKAVIAEGIESADDAWVLRSMGCSLGQGFHFGRPMAPDAFATLLDQRTGTDVALAG